MKENKRRGITSNFSKLVTVSIGHFTNDFYMNVVPPLLFLFAAKLSFNMSQQGFIAFVILAGGSFAQPLIGYLVDKKGKPGLLIYSVLWIAIIMSISGFINNYYLLIVLVGLGALASALFHPLGSVVALSLSGKAQGRNLSVFMTIGGLAASVAPLVAIPLATNFGLESLIFLLIPGLLVAFLMYLSQLHKLELKVQKVEQKQGKTELNAYSIKWLAVFVFIYANKEMIIRSFIIFGVQLLLLKELNPEFAALVISLFLFINSAGVIIGGILNDIIGNKKVVIMYSLLSIIGIMAIILSTNSFVLVGGFLFVGFCLSGINTANIMLARNLIPQNATLATGLMMGFAGGLGAIGVFLFGSLADVYGLETNIKFLLIPLIIVTLLALLIPKKLNKELL